MFQSLIGFKINWNECVDRHVPGAPVFQSLIGLKINWNGGGGSTATIAASFNP